MFILTMIDGDGSLLVLTHLKQVTVMYSFVVVTHSRLVLHSPLFLIALYSVMEMMVSTRVELLDQLLSWFIDQNHPIIPSQYFQGQYRLYSRQRQHPFWFLLICQLTVPCPLSKW